MALDTATLEANVSSRVKALDMVNDDVAAKTAAIIAEEVGSFLEPLVSAFNSHTHAGVITAVTGGSGSPAVGVAGSCSATTSTV